jgi:hypothetical protein
MFLCRLSPLVLWVVLRSKVIDDQRLSQRMMTSPCISVKLEESTRIENGVAEGVAHVESA